MNYILPNFILELFGALVLLVVIVYQLSVPEEQETRLGRLFLLALCLQETLLLLDASVWAVDWLPGPSVYRYAQLANFLVYSLSFLTIISLVAYMAESIPLDTRTKRVVGWICGVTLVGAHILLVHSQFSGIIYHVDEQNNYILGPWFFVPHLVGLLLYGLIILLVVSNRKKLGRRATLTFLTYVLIPTAALLLNVVFYYLMLVYAAQALALLVTFVNLQMQRERQRREQELELMESQVAIMLSQIQPHFLYNALYSISQLCDIDAGLAKESILDFGQYLRGNLDSLSRKEPIPFEEELRHVTTYLSLEKKRFDERLEVVYDIQATDFSLPPLSLQPMVENAVRYGVTKTRDGGAVTIRTREEREAWRVEVLDDGVGFNPGAPPEDGRSHVGIENVRKRLELLCGGTLAIESAPGQGTRVTIRLPKERP